MPSPSDSSHYSLLSLGRSGFKGPVARAINSYTGKTPWTLKILSALSRFIPGEIELLGLRVAVNEQERLLVKPTGLLAHSIGRKVAESVEEAIQRRGRPLLKRDGQFIFSLYQPPIPSMAAMKVIPSRLIKARTGRPLPTTATLQVTSRCQADCYHCSAARHRDLRRPELSTEELKSIIRQTEALGMVNITFTGGEPMLRPDIYDLIAFVRPDESDAMMFTNGLLLTKENVKKLKDAGLYSLYVSLDSPDPETHDQLRRVPGCWQRAIDGLGRALDAGLLCGISTYADPVRLHNGQVREMIELARRIGVHEITIFDMVPTGKLLHHEERNLLTDEDKTELCRLEEEINARPGYPLVVTQAHVNGPIGSGCFAGWHQFYMNAYGDVTPCDFTPLKFGNLREDSLATIWQRMIEAPPYCAHSTHCRMQDADFRRQWIDPIPSSGPFPYPAVQELPGGSPIIPSSAIVSA
jgi:MoaA/NifB/PqqE/SkfB family radical SAM enzyme